MSESFTFDRFLSLPRLSGLRLSPDGRRLVVAVARPDPEGKAMRTALWQVDPAGTQPARRVTRSSAGESAAAFARDGSVLFTSSRDDPDRKPEPERKIAALWALPPDGGEARLLVAPEGGIEGVAAARDADVVAFGAYLHRGAASLEEDAEREKARREAGVGALLFDDYPIRRWDTWLAPRGRRLFAAPLPADPEARLEPRDVTGDAGTVFVETGFDLSPDGATLVAAWQDYESRWPIILQDLVAIDVASGGRRQLTHGDAAYSDPRVSPDGRFVACLRTTHAAVDAPASAQLWLVDLESGEGRPLAPGLDLWPNPATWLPDSSALVFTADRLGSIAAFRVERESGAVTRLVSSGATDELCPSPDGETIYALHSTLASPPRIVRFSSRGEDQTPERLPNAIGGEDLQLASRVERLGTTADDGVEIGSWLVLPADASPEHPAPLVVWVHGGPLGSWEDHWHWRWNPQLLVARGYAVLAPDPALSYGYGQQMIDRGWGDWSKTPYTDVIAAADAAIQRPDLDASRTALMGGSFGGYMANWMAGRTDRFRAIVTHASVWNMRAFHGATDEGPAGEQELGDPYEHPEWWDRQSPAESVRQIRTPMLVIHGERDFRVPISEALMLWTDLRRFGVPARFLYFPDENHWILKPQNARVWYETVLAFLDEHVLGKEWVKPALL